MKLFLPFILGLCVLVQSCTGQKPADLKNSTTSRRAVKGSCSSMVFEGQVLSKKNILNIFDCSGWEKKYPDLNLAIKNSDEKSIDHVFKVFNDNFFSTKEKRKASFELVANAEARGEMNTLSHVLEKSLADHEILTQITKVLNTDKLKSNEKSAFMKVFSITNDENIKIVSAFKNIIKAYELNKSSLNNLLTNEDKNKLIEKASALMGDISQNMDNQSWKQLSSIVHSDESPIQKWAIGSANGDVNTLLDIIEEPNFYNDISFLSSSLETGVRCGNRASTKDFYINVGQELKHIIEGLKFDDKESFERILLHGLTKFLAFQEFCEEKEQQQGINSFYAIIKHAFNVLPSAHDFNFLKKIHVVFGEDRFRFLSFLKSKSFSGLRDLMIDLNADGRDEQIAKMLFEVLSEVSSEDLITVSEMLNELATNDSKTKLWYGSWGTLWNGLSEKEKDDFITFTGIFLSEGVRTSDVLNFLESTFVAFPLLSPDIARNLSDHIYQKDLRYAIKVLAQEKVQEQLSVFLSNKGLFEFIEIMTQEYVAPTTIIQPIIHNKKIHSSYVEKSQTNESVQTRTCFKLLTENYERDTNYYNLVNTLPESCLNVLGSAGFVGQIFLWMNSSEAYFKEHYQVNDFHSATGVWSPGMLQFIFTAAVKADFVLSSNDGKLGIKQNLDEIHRVMTDARLLETFHQFSKVYTSLDRNLGLDYRLLKFVNSKNDAELNQITSDSFKLLGKSDSLVNVSIKPNHCSEFDANLGAKPCQSNASKVEGFLKILRILKRKNENENSLIKELVNWVHPSGGVELPFKKPTTRKHQASIDEMIRFLYDLSSKETMKSFKYHTENNVETVQGTVIDRLEVIIRDIGFSNNFYGAYFKNQVASSTDYRQNLIDSEKLLKLLDNSGGMFRGVKSLPDDSKHRLKNARQTYGSLLDLSDNYPQSDGTFRSYGPFIQSLLSAIGTSSKLSTQKFNAYRIPSERVVEGHNGIFLTTIVEMSGLRHLSQFVRSRFDANLSELNSTNFKRINNNLIARHELNKIQNAFQLVLDKYLDNDRNQINLIIKDAVGFFSNLKTNEQKLMEEIALKAMLLLSDKNVSNRNIETLAKMMEMFIEMWPEMREIIFDLDNKEHLLSLINNSLNSLVSNPSELNRVTDVLVLSSLFDIQDFKNLLADREIKLKLTSFLNQIVTMQDFQSDLNWAKTFQAVLSPTDTQWESLKSWYQTALSEKQDKLTVSLLISFLGEKTDNEYRLKGAMDELFLNHRPELEQFLSETFKSLEFKPD